MNRPESSVGEELKRVSCSKKSGGPLRVRVQAHRGEGEWLAGYRTAVFIWMLFFTLCTPFVLAAMRSACAA